MNKKTNKFVIIFLILMMAMPFFTFNVGASDVVFENWDSYAEGVNTGTNNYVTWWSDGAYTTDTTEYVSSPMSLECPLPIGNSYAYVNMTEDTSLTGFEYSFYYTDNMLNYYSIVTLRNETGSTIVEFKINLETNGDVEIYDYDTYATIDTVVTDTWYSVGFQGNHSVGNPINYVYYYLKDSDGDILDSIEKRWCSLDAYGDEQILNQIYIDIYSTYTSALYHTYFDDFTILDYHAPEYKGGFDFDATDNIGNLDTSTTIGLNSKDIEFMYFVPVTINATGFDLTVDSDMHYWDDDLSNYDFYINGESMGNPTEWKEYGNNYVLRWTFIDPKVITNSVILFELWHDVDVGVGTTPIYWNVGVGVHRQDMDDDWVINMRHSNVYPNGVHDGTRILRDVAYQLYFDSFTFIEDEIDVTYDSITTIDGSYYVGDPVPLTYMLQTSNMVYDNYVKIWNDDTSTEITSSSMQGFPYLCQYQLETIGFVALVSANYTAELYINGANVTNVSFFVDDHINPDMYVFTYPNPSKVGQEIRVEYNFDHPSDKDGAIFLCSSPNLNSYISVNHLSDGDSGFWSETHDTEGTYYYILAVDIDGNGTYGIVSNGIHEHTVVREQGNNYFKLGGYSLKLDVEGTVTQTVTGESNMIFGNCFIYDNNKLIKTITESPFSYSYDIYTAGLHTVEMRLITNVTTILFRQNYSVSTFTGEDEDEIEDTSYILHDWVYNMYGDIGVFLAGVCVVFGCMLIPFALVLGVNVKYSKNIALGDLHWSIYLIFAIVGVVVDVQLHLAELWIILLICVVSIAIAVITYTGNR